MSLGGPLLNGEGKGDSSKGGYVSRAHSHGSMDCSRAGSFE